MKGNTLFHAKKILKKTDGGWHFDINLLFDGIEFSLTEYPIHIGNDDVRVLVPGSDPGSAKTGDVLTDTVDISSRDQFLSIFHDALTDDATELLADVYATRGWTMKLLDAHGETHFCSSNLSDSFLDVADGFVAQHSPCWMELRCAEASFNDDWTLSFDEWTTVFTNIRDGFAPLTAGQATAVLAQFVTFSRFSCREEFRAAVTKQGNSLVLKVTDQCRRMGIDVGDEIDVTMDNGSPESNTVLRVFYSRRWEPIDDPDSICHRDGCDLSMVKRFLDDYRVIGTVNPGMFKPAWPGQPYNTVFDHVNFLKTASGENIIVSQPYAKGNELRYAQAWAEENGCTVEEHREYSWHHPPETTLYVFRKAENPRWRLPKREDPEDERRSRRMGIACRVFPASRFERLQIGSYCPRHTRSFTETVVRGPR